MDNAALITGASSGIGRELAKIHAQRTGDLVITARRGERLRQLQKELTNAYKRRVHIIEMDLATTEGPRKLYEHIKNKNIFIKYLINNAGFGGIGPFTERPWDRESAMIQLNIVALTALIRYFLPDFISRKQGRILNVSSTAGLVPGPLQAVYYATKAYVNSFSNAISEELYNTNITVTTLLPGPTATEFAEKAGIRTGALFGKHFSAAKVAQAGYDGMMKGQLNVIAGVTLKQRVLMKIFPLIPRKILLREVRKVQEQR